MSNPRLLRHITRWVLLVFALSLGVAIASPLVKPQVMNVICSGAGDMKLMVQTDDGAVEVGSHGLDCPLCAALGAPPPALITRLVPAPAPGHIGLPSPAEQTCQAPHAPWQARAPPAWS